jgi:ribonucleoside-diphosphate reductase alpha chain
MALQFIEGYREANSPVRNQPELAIPGLLEEVKKKVNRPVTDLPLAEDAIIARSNGGSNGQGRAPSFTSISATIAHFQLDAPTCPSCGHVAVRNGACYKCLNCGESLGCS